MMELLQAAGVDRVVDVRRFPGSRRNPQFARDRLAVDLPRAGMTFEWRGEALGGRRRLEPGNRHVAWRSEAFRAYAGHMESVEFRTALAALEGEIRSGAHVAIMCAETLWWSCHRRLIADALAIDGFEVRHLVDRAPGDHHLVHPCLRRGPAGALIYDRTAVPGLTTRIRADHPRRPKVTGAVIAGGASRRMGRDKRSIPVDGIPLLRRAAEAVRSVADELVVACRRESLPDSGLLEGLEACLAYDRLEDAGPAAGLEAAIAAARGEIVVVVAGDMPWIDPAVLRLLLDEARRHPEARAVALRSDWGPEPFLAVYRRRVLPELTALLDGGMRRMHEVLAALEAIEIRSDAWRRADPSGRSVISLNEPGDLPFGGAEGGPSGESG